MINDDLERLASRGPYRDPGEVIDSALATAASPKRRVQARFVAVSVVVLLVAGLVAGLASLRNTDSPAATGPTVVTLVPAPSVEPPTSTTAMVTTETSCPAVEVRWPDRSERPTMVGATVESGSIGGTVGGYQLATDPYVFLLRGFSLDDAGDLTAEQQAAAVPVTINGYVTEVRPPAAGTGGQSVRFVFPPTASPADPCNVWMINANTPMDVDEFVALLGFVDMALVDELPIGPPSNPEDRLASWPDPPASPTPADDIPVLLPTASIVPAETPVRAQVDGRSDAPATFTQLFADADRDILVTLQTHPGSIESTPAEMRRPLTIEGWDDAFATDGDVRLVASDPSGFVRLMGTGIDDDAAVAIIESMQRRSDGIAGWDLSADTGLVEINGAWNESAGQRFVTWFDGDRVVAQMLTSPAHTDLISQALGPAFEQVDVNGTSGWLNTDEDRRSIVWSPDGITIVVLGVADERIDPLAVAATVTELSLADYRSRTTTDVPAGVGDGCSGSLFC
jgi:hypothetical protein